MNYNKRQKIRKELKMKKCRYCLSKENLTIDHKQPLTKGGTDDLKNLQCLCERCNKMKADIPHTVLMKVTKWWLDINGFEHKHGRNLTKHKSTSGMK